MSSSANPCVDQDAVEARYRGTLEALRSSGIPFMIGGAYALGVHTGVHRDTKDLDLFTLPAHGPAVLKFFQDLGYPARMVARHWLGKITWDDAHIDIITGTRNGASSVEQSWLDRSSEALLFGIPVRVVAPEEMIWSKSFVMERDRYDGADIAHLMRARAGDLDWRRLLECFGPYWVLLLNHLVMFSFIYPGDRHRIPGWLVRDLSARWQRQGSAPGPAVCQGTLLSHSQYVHDLEHEGMLDARLKPLGTLTPEGINE